MAINVVEVLVRAKNMTEAGFAEAEASSAGMAKAVKASGMIAAAGLAVVGVEAVKMASTFQASMERLVTQAGVPQAALKGLQTGVLDLAGTVGFSPDSLAQSLYHVASNMQSMGATSKQMLGVVKVAAEGARVGGADLVDVTNALTSAVASGIPGVKNYAQAMGMLNATVGSGDMTMQNLAEALGTGLLPVLKQYGLSMKDVGAALATFGDLNIRGSEAATKLRMAVQAMSVPSKQGQADFKAMGMSVNQLADDMRHGGLMQALLDLQKHYRAIGVTGTKVGEQLTTDFGKKAGVGLAVLLGNMDRLKSKYPDLTRGAKDFGDAWGKTQQTMAQKLDDLRAGFDALMVTLGDKLLPVVQSVVGWMVKHKQVMTDLVVVVGVLAGALATLAVGIKVVEIATKAWELVQAILDAELLANPIGLIIAGLVLLGVAIYELVKHWRTAWDDIKRWTLDGYHAVTGFFERMWHDVSGFAERIWHDVTGFFERMHNDEVSFVERLWNDVVQFFARIWHDVTNWVSRTVSDAVHWFQQLPGRIIAALSGLPGMLFRAGVNAMQGLINGFTSMVGSVGSAIGGIAKKVAGFFGLSPAVEGPLSGGGAPEIRGQHFVQDFARGMTGGLPDLSAAASAMAGRAGAFGPGGGGGGGPMVVQLELRGNPGGSGLDHLFWEWLKQMVRNNGGGGGTNSVQRALGQSW